MPTTLLDKIWDAHLVHQEVGAPDMLFIDLQLLHEVTSPQAFTMLKKEGLSVLDPTRNFATLDHSIPTDEKRENFADEKNRFQLEAHRKNCAEYDISLYDIDSGHQGVVHVTGPELGLTQPGMTIVCGDSHTSTHGAFGALAFGIGTTQIFHVLASSCLLLDKPKSMKVHFVGTPSKYFSAKDAILALIRQIGVEGGTGHTIEYTGEYIRNLSMEERMTICNMSIECGARAGIIAPDEKTFEWIKQTKRVPEEQWQQAVEYWKSLVSDPDALYDAEVIVNIANMKPIVTWGTTPGQSITINETIPNLKEMPESVCSLAQKSLAYTELKAGEKITGTPVQHVFIGSCTNGRMSDLRISAEIIRDKKVANGVRMIVVPGSEQVEAQAKKEGLDKIFKEAGAEFRKPGCSMCLAMNGDEVPARERCASTSNRNFIGRQGPDSITHLMSPLMATITAITGKITDPEEFF
jgi:3-isopropylmalate/(R)-2-methylmalate dehydratase large subunit